MVVNEDAAAIVQAYCGWNKKETFGHDISRRLKELDTQIKKLSPRSRSDINNLLKQVEAKITKLRVVSKKCCGWSTWKTSSMGTRCPCGQAIQRRIASTLRGRIRSQSTRTQSRLY